MQIKNDIFIILFIYFNMNNKNENLLKEVNIDIIFFFLVIVKSLVSFYIITEKKKSILNIPSITNEEANKLYYYNRRLNVVIAIYFFLNAYSNYQGSDPNNNTGEKYLLAATFFILIGSLLYLPLGNSNLIIEN